MALGVLRAGAGSDAGAPLWLIGYILSWPTLIWAHGNIGHGLGTLGIRVGALLVGALVGCAVDRNKGDWGCLGGLVIGGLVSGVAGMIVEYAVLAHEDVPPGEAAKRLRLVPRLALTPDAGRLVPSLGLGASF